VARTGGGRPQPVRINAADLPAARRVAVQDGPMAEIAIDELLADMPVERGARVNPKRVKHSIAQDADATPPVVVLRADDGFVLADGYHRPETAERRGSI
jgi:hypothetical protein